MKWHVLHIIYFSIACFQNVYVLLKSCRWWQLKLLSKRFYISFFLGLWCYNERSHTRDDNWVATEVYLFQKDMENINKTPKEKWNGHRNQIQVRELVMQWECISTFHICFTQRKSFSYICKYEYYLLFVWFILVIKYERRKTKDRVFY